MIAVVILALGLVFCVEGLVFALAPSRLEDLLRMLAEIPADHRRVIGLAAVALGVVLVWIAKSLGA